MDQIKYQGYARDRGFDPIQLSRGGVEAIAQQGSAMSRQMRQNQETFNDNRNTYQNQIQEKQRQEAANRNSNFDFEQRSRDSHFKAVSNRFETIIQNDKNNAASIEKTFGELAKFSETMGKVLVAHKKKQDETEEAQGYRDYMLNGPDPQQQAAVQAGLAQLDRSNTLIQTTADKLEDSGAPPETVHAIRKTSKAYQVGFVKAQFDRASIDYGGWLEEQYSSNNELVVDFNGQQISPTKHAGPDQREAINSVLFKQYLKERNLMGVNPELAGPALFKMRQAEQKLLDKERDNFITAANEATKDQIDTAFDVGIQTDPVNAFQSALNGYSHLKDENGRRLGYGRSRDLLLQRINDSGAGVDVIRQIGDSPAPHAPGKTWAELYPGAFKKAERAAMQQEVQDENLRDNVETQEYENWSDKVLEQLYQGNAPEERVQEAITQSERIWGKVDPRLKDYKQNNTLQARAADEQNKTLNDLFEKDELTVEELNSGKYSGAVKEKWMDKAEAADKRRTPEMKAAREAPTRAVENALKGAANLLDSNKTPHWTFELAKAHAARQLEAKARVYMQSGKSPEEAYSLASVDVIREIELNNKNPSDPKLSNGTYSVSSEGEGAFKRWAGSTGQASGITKAAENVSYIRSQVINGGAAAITNRKLITEAEAKTLINPDSPVPPIISVIQNALPNGKEMSEFDIIDAQLNAWGLGKRERPFIQQQADKAMSPALNHLLYRTPTRRRTERGLTGAGISATASDGTPIGPSPERQAIGHIANTLGVSVSDVVTFINYETAGQLVSGGNRSGLDTWGGTGGRYLGWIQFSPDNQRKYNVRPGMSPMEMANATIKYLQNSGIKRGDSLAHLYQAIQAPAYLSDMRKTGQNIGSDSNGSISGHVSNMKRNHQAKATSWLGQGAGTGRDPNAGSPWRDASLMSAPAKRLLSQTRESSGYGAQESFRANAHGGVDHAVPTGTKISFKQPGTVVDVGNPNEDNGGYGGFIDVRLADGNVVRIAHLSDVKVKKGQRLRAKQVAALSGSTGRSTGPHTHTEHLNGPDRKGKRNPSWITSQVYADI